MNSNLVKYEVADDALKNVAIEVGTKADFSKYKENNISSAWMIIQDKSARWLLQLNVNNKMYCGFATEPYKLFLSHAKESSIKAIEIQNSFNTKIINSLLANNFKLEFVEQDTFDRFLLSKINCVVFLIMAVESFVNGVIPHNFSLNNKDKIAIERCSLRDKLQNIIPNLKRIEDITLYQNKCSDFLNLNKLRNNFIHLKTSNPENKLDPFVEDLQKILILDIEDEHSKIEDFILMISQYQNVR